jgi:hypothetical protein
VTRPCRGTPEAGSVLPHPEAACRRQALVTRVRGFGVDCDSIAMSCNFTPPFELHVRTLALSDRIELLAARRATGLAV